MRLSLQTDFALRTLMFLASVQRRATVKEIAEYFRISHDHVAKVVHLLGKRGWIRNVRGSGGGVELADAPDTIRVGEVIAEFEGNVHLLECVGRQGVCVVESFCKLKSVLAEAERVQRVYLDSVTIADVAPTSRQLKKVEPVADP